MLTNNLSIWVFMATACVVAGFALSQGTTKRVYFLSGIGAGFVVLALGIWSVFFLMTDEKVLEGEKENEYPTYFDFLHLFKQISKKTYLS